SQCGANRALRVVLVRGRCTEDGHHRVADELLDRPTEPLDLVLHPRVVRTQNRAHVFRISTVGAVREADEVDEEHRYDLPLLGGLRLLDEWCAARETEARAFGVLLAAGGTDERHGFQVWRAREATLVAPRSRIRRVPG